jgi:hypothetical protein
MITEDRMTIVYSNHITILITMQLMPVSKCKSSTVQVQKECQQYLVFQLVASFLEVKQAKLT